MSKKEKSKPQTSHSSASGFPFRRGAGLDKKSEVRVDCSPDGMEASLTLIPAANDPIDFGVLERLLRNQRIKYGVDWDRLRQLVERANDFEVIQSEVFAEGEPPVNGKTPLVLRYFEEEAYYKREPLEEAGEAVNHRDVQRINMVRKGQLIAEKIEFFRPQGGRNIFDEMVAPAKEKDIPLRAGKNTLLNDKGELYSQIDGRPTLDEHGRVSVMQVYLIEGDLGLQIGNVEFNGDVEVQGSVRSGFSIKAGGSVLVRESVEAATIIAQENITIRGAFSGGDKGLLRAGENCHLTHVNAGHIETEGNLLVSRELVNVTAVVYGSLSFRRGKGSIRGGELIVQDDLEVIDLGSELGVPTTVFVGPYEISRRRLKLVHVKLREIEEQTEQQSEALEKLKSDDLDSTLSKQQKRFVQEKLQGSLEVLQRELKKMGEEERSLEEKMEAVQTAFLRVAGKIFPGVIIHIGQLELRVPKKMSNVEFYVNPGGTKILCRDFVPSRK